MNYIEEAKRHLAASFNSESSTENYAERENAKTIALIAIAEQLRIANLVKLGEGEPDVDLSVNLENINQFIHDEYTFPDWNEGRENPDPETRGRLKPDIAEALGIKERES